MSDALLRDLIEHFSRISMSNQAVQAEILGQAYEYLITNFADATKKKAVEFYNPRSIVRFDSEHPGPSDHMVSWIGLRRPHVAASPRPEVRTKIRRQAGRKSGRSKQEINPALAAKRTCKLLADAYVAVITGLWNLRVRSKPRHEW